MGKKKTVKASEAHPLRSEIEGVLKAYEKILVAAQKRYRDPNVIAATLLGMHVAVGNVILESVTALVTDRKGARK